MKKITLLLILFALMALTTVKGFQLVEENSMHLMNGEIMTGHNMPAPDCDTKTCLMLAEVTLILGAFISAAGVEMIARIFIASGFGALSFLLFAPLLQGKNPFIKNRLRKIPIGVESVIFRE